MNILASYKNQVELLLDVLPFIQHDPRFALKGGTAINLFHRNMPRLSVDIDLTYLPIEPRDIFLNNLTLAMQELADKMTEKISRLKKNVLANISLNCWLLTTKRLLRLNLIPYYVALFLRQRQEN